MDFKWLATIKDSKTAKISIILSATLLSGILVIYYFKRQDFYNLSTSKLILLSLAITMTILMLNMFIGMFQKDIWAMTNIEERIGFMLLSSGIITSDNVYVSLLMCYFDKSKFSSFIKGICAFEIIYIIIALIIIPIVQKSHKKFLKLIQSMYHNSIIYRLKEIYRFNRRAIELISLPQ